METASLWYQEKLDFLWEIRSIANQEISKCAGGAVRVMEELEVT